MKTFGLLSILFVSSTAWAGFFEVGLSGSYRESFITQEINSKSSSVTGSVSYYYMERSAIQFSFTQAVRREHLPGELNITDVNIIGLDIVLSFADRKARLQPFIKAGAAQVEKKFTRQSENQVADDPVTSKGPSLSAGLGIKLKLTETLAVNLTVDGWTAPISEDFKAVDLRVLGGFSWFF